MPRSTIRAKFHHRGHATLTDALPYTQPNGNLGPDSVERTIYMFRDTDADPYQHHKHSRQIEFEELPEQADQSQTTPRVLIAHSRNVSVVVRPLWSTSTS